MSSIVKGQKPPPPPKSNKYSRLSPDSRESSEFVTVNVDDNNIYDPGTFSTAKPNFLSSFLVFNNGRPTFPPPPKPYSAASTSNNVQIVRNQVNDVASIARENVEKVLRRDDKLHDLDSRAADLHTGAQNFSNQATKLKRKVSLFGGEFGQNLNGLY